MRGERGETRNSEMARSGDRGEHATTNARQNRARMRIQRALPVFRQSIRLAHSAALIDRLSENALETRKAASIKLCSDAASDEHRHRLWLRPWRLIAREWHVLMAFSVSCKFKMSSCSVITSTSFWLEAFCLFGSVAAAPLPDSFLL